MNGATADSSNKSGLDHECMSQRMEQNSNQTVGALACIPNELFWILGMVQSSCTLSQLRAVLYTHFPTPQTVEVYTGVDGLKDEKETSGF